MVHLVSKFFSVRNIVSRSRRRMVVDGYDLDMSYITPRLLAMSFPAERIRAVFRNPLWQVKNVLDMKHPGHYKVGFGIWRYVEVSNIPLVYNLCAEESYDPSHFHGRVEVFPFDDNHVPTLQTIKLLCESVFSWLSQDLDNIAVIHCMAGKGRTGLMVCSYLVYCGMTTNEAFELYANRRTTNNRGVSIPSQRRYVGYWSSVLTFLVENPNGPPIVELPQPNSRELLRIRLYDTINTNAVYFVVAESQEVPGQRYRPSIEVARNCCRGLKKGCQITESPKYYMSFVDSESDGNTDAGETPRCVVQMDTERSTIYQKKCLDYNFQKPLQVAGDVRVIFYEKMLGGRLFYVCFNTAFIRGSLLQIEIGHFDGCCAKWMSAMQSEELSSPQYQTD